MIAVDTNILVYAHRADSPWHGRAAELVRGLAEGPDTWAIPWPCIHEFLSIVTHPKIYKPPSPLVPKWKLSVRIAAGPRIPVILILLLQDPMLQY